MSVRDDEHWRGMQMSGHNPPMSDAGFGELGKFLVSTPFFGGLDGESLEFVASMLTEKACMAGSDVFEEGDTGRAMYILKSGEVVMKRRGQAYEVRLARLHAGDFFGETTLIEMQPRPCTAHVVRDARLLELTGANLYRLYKEDIKAYVLVLQNINRELSRRLRHADDLITKMADEYVDESVQARTVKTLLIPRY